VNRLRSMMRHLGQLCLLCLLVLLGFGVLVPASMAHTLDATVAAATSSATGLRDIVGHVDEGHIRKLAAMGVVSGYGGGLFGPEDLVTREQFAKMVVLCARLPVDTSQGVPLSFDDYGQISEWAKPYVLVAVQYGLIKGTADNRFAPKANVTRVQALTMIARALVGDAGLAAMPGASSRTGFSDDASIQSWARPAVNYCLQQGIVSLSDHSNLQPDKPSTRAMNCRYLSRFLGSVQLDPATYQGVTFSRSFHEKGYYAADYVEQTSDGGYILAGDSYEEYSSGIWLIKLDPWGTKEWSRFYSDIGGYPTQGFLGGVRQTPDGGYILAGSLRHADPYEYSGLVIKLDACGREEWSRTWDHGLGRVELSRDGGYVFDGGNLSLLKTDGRGRLEWSKTFHEQWKQECIHCIQQTRDGGYILAGTRNNQGLLIKTDSRGNKEWGRVIGGLMTSFHSVMQTHDGGYILAGVDFEDAWMVKVDASGNEQWSKTYGRHKGAHYVFTAVEAEDGGFVLTGCRGIPPVGFLLKTDSQGVEQWFRSVLRGDASYESKNPILPIKSNEGPLVFEPRCLGRTADGGYVVAGTARNFSFSTRAADYTEVWVMKTDAAGNVNSPHTRLVTEVRPPSADPAEWGTDFTQWCSLDIPWAPGQRFHYEIKSYDKTKGLRSGWYELTVTKYDELTVLKTWRLSFDGEESSSRVDYPETGGWVTDGWGGLRGWPGWPTSLYEVAVVIQECHLNDWHGGSWSSVTHSCESRVQVTGKRTYAGVIGAYGDWERRFYYGGSLSYCRWGEFCINPNIRLPLYVKVCTDNGWVEWTLTEIEGF